uniref:Legume lectin domain-containing protein n=1 Tax=Oryza meridionalis TaxID=40149 RepID=A0A0E0DQH3_9ORYZ
MPRVPLLLLLLLLVAGATACAAAETKPTAYEALATFDFPPGILPKGVVSYTLDGATGDFTATLNTTSTCAFSIQGSYSLRYQRRLSGRIAADRLTNLQGVSVKILFLWVNIVEVTRHGDELGFSVGIASADFGIDNFLESPQCGCGFDCHDHRDLSLPLPEPSLRLRGAF